MHTSAPDLPVRRGTGCNGGVASGNLGSRFEFEDERHQEMDREYTLEHYLDFRKDKGSYAARFGSETVEKMELMWKRDAQEALLSNRRLELRSIAALLRPRYGHRREDPLFASILTATSKMARSVYEHPFMSVDFGARAVKQGESKEFRERVRQGLFEAKARTPLLYPLLAPCGVTVLYLPPRNASKIDLDNLMRESIIPAVHEILQPPGSPRDFLAKVNEDKIEPHVAEMLERYKSANPEFRYTLEDLMVVHPVQTDKNCDLVQTLASCVQQVAGTEAIYAASPGTYDQKHVVRIANVAQCVAYGPGMLAQAHLPDEYCRIDDIVSSAKVMALTAVQLLGVE